MKKIFLVFPSNPKESSIFWGSFMILAAIASIFPALGMSGIMTFKGSSLDDYCFIIVTLGTCFFVGMIGVIVALCCVLQKNGRHPTT